MRSINIIYHKGISLLIALSFSGMLLAQIPAGYYDTANGKTGTTLQQALHDIIANHTTVSYTPGVWNAFATTDVLASPNNTTIWDIYSDIPSGTPPYQYTLSNDQCGTYAIEGDCYNREHSFPQSWFNSASPMVTDLHHIFATDGKVNGIRSSYPFGTVSSPTNTTQNGSKLGPNTYSGYSGTVFEPINEYKGDLARAYFYMATRYYGEDSGWPGSDMVTGSQPKTWALNMLMEWHTNDPVSTKETDRNDAVYDIQANRNPFIDDPDYVDCIWGASCGTAPSITNIAHSPASPTSSDAVTISADIEDDVSVSSATIYWGTDGSTFPNSITMTVGTAPAYSADNTITAQSTGTTVSYKITAIDGDSESTTSSTNSYTIPKAAPTTQATAITNSDKGSSFISLSWTNGDGDNRVVIMNTSNSFTNPVDGNDPTANSVYSGSGEQTVYNSSSNSIMITGLLQNTAYWFRIYEYNNTGTATKYITSTASNNPISITTYSTIISEDFSTCPASGWTIYSVASNKNWTCSASGYIDINAYAGDIASDDWFISSAINLDNYLNESLTFTSYTQYSDISYPRLFLKYSTDYSGSGDPSVATWTSLSFTASAENSTNWTNSGVVDLSAISGSSVYIAFQYTSSGIASGSSSLWEIDDITISGSTAPLCSEPSTQASNISFSSVTDIAMSVSWTRGNGDNILVLAHAGSAVDTDPASGTSYTANSAFGSGEELGSGNFVIYNGNGTSVSLSTLSNSTTYYYAAYEYNNTDVCYNLSELTGNQTTNGVPILSTTDASSITSTTASSGGNISSNGGSSVTARGVCWSTATNPTTADSKTTDGTGTGVFSSAITGLSASTTYYIRAYATNIYGTAYGSQVSFSTIKTEPANHVTSFTCGTTTSSTIPLSWTDASAGILPDGYLIKASDVDLGSISAPVDGTAESDATLVKNVTQGTESATFSGLSASTTYYFKIYPYTNSGSNINYKLDGTIPNTNCATDAAAGSCATDLIISEYIEGSSNNKYIEIYNGTGSSVDLSDYKLRLYANGASTPNSDIALSGTLNDNSTIVYQNSSAVIYGGTVENNAACSFNGDDAIALYKVSSASNVDIFGRIGEDPGSSWTDGGNSTVDKTLVRKSDITDGITTNPASGFATLITEWDMYNQDEISYLGSHTMSCASCTPPSTQASSYSTTSISGNSLSIEWARGSGDNVLVVAKSGSAVDTDPTSGTSYTANAAFGSGTQIETGNYVIYAGTGTSVSVTGLSAGTIYHFAIYEYATSGTCYNSTELTGNETTYTTPTILSTLISSITKITASGGGNVTDDGGPSVTSKGVVWGISTDPTLPSTNSTLDGTGTGVFTSSISGLSAGTTYYIRAYATNSEGTSYGSEESFTTIKDEPTNHPTTIAVSTSNSSSISLTWTDASAGITPDYYLVKMSNTGLGDIADPVDGTTESDGALIQNISQGTQTCTFSGLSSSTTYYFKIYSYSNSDNNVDYKTDATIANANGTTSSASNSCPTELLISEYIEGSGYNKAIEIYNKTGSTVDLSTYSLKKQSNGAGAFGDELTLSGSLTDETTYVIVNSSAGATLLAIADMTTASACIGFNGNDAVALYKSGVQIDVVGVIDQTTNWGADMTMVRNSDIVSPTTTYSVSDWGSYSQDEFSYIGSHTINCGSCDVPTTQANSITFSNVSTTTLTLNWFRGNGDGVIVKMNTSNSFTNPVNGTDPAANTVYSSGEQVIFNADGTTVDITSLTSNTQYFFTVYEKNCTGGNIKFLTTSPPDNTQITINGVSGGSPETIAFQGFEGTGADNWGYTLSGTTVDAGSAKTNTYGVLLSASTNYITFDEVDVSSYTSISIQISDATSGGIENNDALEVSVAINGGSYPVSPDIVLKGSTANPYNTTWDYNASGEATTTSGTPATFQTSVTGSDPAGYATITINIPDGTTSVSLKIACDNISGENFHLDDLTLTGSTSGYTSTNTDYFRTATNGAYSSASTWQSSDDNTNWYVSTLVPDVNATDIIILDNTSITHSSDFTVNKLTIKNGSAFSFSADNMTLTNLGDLIVDAGGTLDLSRTGSLLKLNGSSLQTISGSGTINVYNLELNNSSNASFTNDVVILNQLTLSSGKINSTANTITIDNTSETAINVFNSTNYINGIVKRAVNTTGSYQFPIGSATNYEYIKIDLNSSSGISYLTASFSTSITGSTPSLTLNSVNINSLLNAGIWTISPDAVSSVNYDVTLISQGHNNGGISSDYHTILKRDNSSSAWGLYGSFNIADQSGSSSDPITLKRTGITGFSDFGGGSGDNPLPIELLSFDLKNNNGKVDIFWTTISETNNDFFTIERSTNYETFQELLFFPGAGNSNQINNYYLCDENPLPATAYYRIKQTYFDGKYSYSRTQSISIQNKSVEKMPLAYSIFVDEGGILKIKLNNISENYFNLSIFNFHGKLVYQKMFFKSNAGTYEINTNSLKTGIYLVKLNTGKTQLSKKVWIN